MTVQHVLATQENTRLKQAMGSQTFLDLSGNVGAGVQLGCTISWKCLLHKIISHQITVLIKILLVSKHYRGITPFTSYDNTI